MRIICRCKRNCMNEQKAQTSPSRFRWRGRCRRRRDGVGAGWADPQKLIINRFFFKIRPMGWPRLIGLLACGLELGGVGWAYLTALGWGGFGVQKDWVEVGQGGVGICLQLIWTIDFFITKSNGCRNYGKTIPPKQFHPRGHLIKILILNNHIIISQTNEMPRSMVLQTQ